MKNKTKVDKKFVVWMACIYFKYKKLEINYENFIKSIGQENTVSDIKNILLDFKIDMKKSDFSSEDIHFAFYCKDEEWQIVIVRADNEKHNLLFCSGETKEISLQELKGLEVFRLKNKINYFDLGDKDKSEEFGLKWFLKEMWQHKSLWKNVVAYSILIQLLSFALPLMTQAIVDKVIVNQAQSTLIALVIGVFLFNMMSIVFNWSRQQLILYIGQTVDKQLAIQVISKLFRLPMNYFSSRSTGTTVGRTYAIESIRDFLTGSIITLILDLPFAMIFLIIMFYYSTLLSSISLAFIAFMITVSVIVAPILRKKAMDQAKLGGRNQAFLTEYVSNMSTVKSLQIESVAMLQYKNNLSDYLEATQNTKKTSINYNTVMSFLEQSMNLVILGVGAYLSMENLGFTIGMLIAFQMFASRVSAPMLKIASIWQEFQQTQISMLRLKDIMDETPENYSMEQTVVLKEKIDIEIKSLGFKYPNANYLYKNFNLHIQTGELCVIQGESGCGKSTLTQLIQGNYQNYEGCIEVGGVDIKQLSVLNLRSLMGVVPQESVLFAGTILDNFKLIKPDATIEEISDVCQKVGIHEAINALPQGYQTHLGERGVGLSGGQKQRLAIARVLIKNPKILIFDESTSSLDSQSAQMVVDTIKSLEGLVTMIFITHALPEDLKHARLIKIKKPQ